MTPGREATSGSCLNREGNAVDPAGWGGDNTTLQSERGSREKRHLWKGRTGFAYNVEDMED